MLWGLKKQAIKLHERLEELKLVLAWTFLPFLLAPLMALSTSWRDAPGPWLR